MARVHVAVKRDHLESLTIAKPIPALAEIIWNGFDASATRVQVFLSYNEMDGLHSIRVRDNGYGIDIAKVEDQFGNLGESWKKRAVRQEGRILHGKNGKGRFRAFGLGSRVQWNTSFSKGDKFYRYSITGRIDSLDDFEVSEILEDVGPAGTEVIIENLRNEFRSLTNGGVHEELAKLFAAYLTDYPTLTLVYEGLKVDPAKAQVSRSDYNLGDVSLNDGRHAPVSLSIVEWRMSTDRAVHLCDRNGISLHETSLAQRIRAPGFNFTVYVKSDAFVELDSKNQLSLADLHPDAQSITKLATAKVKEHFRRRLLENQSQTVERWKKQLIYPYLDKVNLDPVELAERQMFEILAVNVESYLPQFEDADLKAKRFTFKLLAQAIGENPESVQKIISEVLGLKKEAQDELAELLEKTPLSQIISTAKIVANRLDFLNALESLLFDPESKQTLLERDQLHKILEGEAWLFHEEFALAGSEQRLGDVLEKHLGLLRCKDTFEEPTLDGKAGRIDLLLHKVAQPRPGEYDFLVVELKRPSKKIDADVITQVKRYASTVAKDERFHHIPARWTFLAVSNEMDEYARSDSRQRNMKPGCVFDDAERNITVWIRTWSEVINEARARLQFVNQHLAYEADRESSVEYLKKAHAKFLPRIEPINVEIDPEEMVAVD